MNPVTLQFHVPTKPYSAVDALNRAAAAQGSFGYAMAASDADYNGHKLSLYWNDYRGYYVCDYNWGERVVIARGDLKTVLIYSIEAFARQGRGASLRISVKEEDAQLVRDVAAVREGKEDFDTLKWYTWRHRRVGDARFFEKHLGVSSSSLLCAVDEADFDFITSREGRAELHTRKPLPEALKVQA